MQAATEQPTLGELGHDLLKITKWQRVRGLTTPFVASAMYWVFASFGYWPLAVASLVVLSFVTYGSISHDLVHRTLGVSPRVGRIFLSLIELLALRSGHAYRAIHLHHHARYPHDDDVEGQAAKMSFWRAIAEGFVFVPRTTLWALKHAKTDRTWIICETIVVCVLIVTSIALLPISMVPFGYVALMIAGSWIIPIITSWIPHDPTQEDPVHQTRVFRGFIFRVIAIDHLYHLEHHLYPAVPHQNWPELAKRLNPWLDEQGIEPIRL
ncbi:MAG: fatty acid desaturase [Planctomycetaceae bacterium]